MIHLATLKATLQHDQATAFQEARTAKLGATCGVDDSMYCLDFDLSLDPILMSVFQLLFPLE